MSNLLDTFLDENLNATVSEDGGVLGHDEHESGHAHHVTLAVLSLMILLGIALVIGQLVERYSIDWISEAGGALLLGIAVGLVLEITPLPIEFEGVFNFSTDFFFIALLPPIIFDAAFNLKVRTFFNNLGAILSLAFGGTVTSMIVVAVFMWLVGVTGLSYKISFFNSCMFGAIISATDPVTILSVFRRLNADKNLIALIFGESVLNDAVSIVLYRVISTTFTTKVITFGGVVAGVYTFCKIFLGSVVIGALFGGGAAWIFKTRYFHNEHSSLEASLVIVFAYCSFYSADGCGFSGIVSIMVCGIMMAQYVRPNLNGATNDRVGSFFKTISSLAEIFVFVYIGFAVFTQTAAWSHGLTWGFVGFCLIALALSRAANVYPNMMIINFFRPPEMAIPRAHMHMSWFSGLRGAMAFALASLARDKLGKDGDVIVTATFFMVLITVLVNGGATTYLLEYLHLKDSQQSATAMHNVPGADSPNFVQITTPSDNELKGIPTPSSSIRGVREKIHQFQRTGGFQEHFKGLERSLGKVLINPNAPPPSGLGHGHGHGSPSSSSPNLQHMSKPPSSGLELPPQ